MAGNVLCAVDVRRLACGNAYDYWYARMSDERKTKTDRPRFMEDKYRSLGAGIALVKALELRKDPAGCAGLLHISDPAAEAFLSGGKLREPAGIMTGPGNPEGDDPAAAAQGIPGKNIKTGVHGKPYFADSGVFYNISHAGDYAVCAVSSKEVGVDIEKKRVFSDRLRNYICEPEEVEAVKSSLSAAALSDHEALTRLWTIKESVMKYYGSGLAIHPAGIKIHLRKEAGDFAHRVSGGGRICVSLDEEAMDAVRTIPGDHLSPEKLRFSYYQLGEHALTVCSPDCPFV